MVAGKSPEWLPPGFTVKIKYKDGKKIQYYVNVATGEKYYSKKKVIDCATEDKKLLFTPQEKKGDDNGSSSINEVDVILDTTYDSAAWLPDGWTVGERIRKSGTKQGTSYKVYTESASGKSFYSKVAVTRYLDTMDDADTMNNKNNSDNLVEPLPDISLQVSMTNTISIHEKKRKGDSLVKSDNVVEPLPDMSVEVLPMPNTGSIREKKRRGNSLAKCAIDPVVEPFPDISPQVISMTNTDGNSEKKRKGSSFVTVSIERTTDDDLPLGWTKEIRTSQSGEKFRKDPFYIDPVSGYMFRSKRDALRYLKSNDIRRCFSRPLKRELDEVKLVENKIPSDNVVEPLPDMSVEVLPMPNTGSIREKKRRGNSLAKICAIDTVVEPFSDISPQVISTTNTDGNSKKKRKGSSFVTVSIERTTDDDLPLGWTKEIRTSQSGDRFRKDPFYIDPVSGYMFRSKPDVLRYLKTNDIRRCFIRPLKRELDEVKLIENKFPSSDPANDKLSMHNRQHFVGEESNGGAGRESSGNNNVKMGNNHVLESDISRNDVGVMAVDMPVSSPVNDPSTKQQIPESGVRTKPGSRKSKKRGDSSVPLRTSKRLAGSEPEIRNTLDLRERTPRAAVKVITASEVDASPSIPLKASDSIPQASIKPAKEAADHAVIGESSAKEAANHTILGESSAKEAADHAIISESPAKVAADHAVIGEETRQDVDQLKEVEKPPTESSAIPEEPSGSKTRVKPLDNCQISQESQLFYDFGDSWSDPLEFAMKTLMGEIPIEDNLTFPSYFGEKLDTSVNQVDGGSAPINLQGEFASHSESSKEHNAVNPLPASSPFSPLQNSVNPLPASSPSFSSLGNIGHSSCGGFNYQPSTEVGKKDSQTKFNP